MTIKSAVPLKTTLMIGNIIAAVGFFIYFIPYQGSQITAYSLFILYSLINAFAIERMVSLRNRGKGKNVGKLFLSVLANLTPALFLILQFLLLILLVYLKKYIPYQIRAIYQYQFHLKYNF